MLAYFVRRFQYALLLLIAVSLVSFIIIQLPPGDYLTTVIQNMRDAGQSDEDIRLRVEALQRRYGLDQPLYVQYGRWVWGLLHGDMGYSFQWQQPVESLIGERIVLTMVVSFTTIVFTWVVAFPIGVYSATHQYSPLDYVFTFVAFVGIAIPDFLLALFLAYALYRLTGMSVIGLFSPEYATAPWSLGRVWDLIKHMGVPIAIVGAAGTAGLVRTLRACILDELGKPYVTAARARGLSEWQLLLRYPIRIAINPLLSTVGYMLPGIVSGTVIVSVVLGLPMTGPLLLRALTFQDMYLAASFVMLLSGLTVVGTFISDLLLAWADPRIRLAS
ncbi:MAG: ABC transporter permease [Firmicutes bacterium]|jgi:peptide/nickel transport system permease protein|nr:ABC transporter permease [Bacillota bacterium]